MLSKVQEKSILSLHTSKGRQISGQCLLEGPDIIAAAGNYLLYSFTPHDTKNFAKLVTTTTPQHIAGVAQIPIWSLKDLCKKPTIVILDTVQDPGNVGAIFRLCLGFDAALLLINSADPTNTKVIRSSAGAFFHVPYLRCSTTEAEHIIPALQRPTYRLELRKNSILATPSTIADLPKNIMLVAGSEGQGITLETKDAHSIALPHSKKLESLNVGHALAIILSLRYQSLA